MPDEHLVSALEQDGYAIVLGDALLLRPLVLHASHKAISNDLRRVIHLAFAGTALPEPLAWHDAA